jgi:hypothetical protein
MGEEAETEAEQSRRMGKNEIPQYNNKKNNENNNKKGAYDSGTVRCGRPARWPHNSNRANMKDERTNEQPEACEAMRCKEQQQQKKR